MDRQVMERLMLDRSLGALGEDVEQLLEAYLAARPDATAVKSGQEFSQAVRAAREAMRTRRQQGEMPPLKLPPLVARRSPWRAVLAMAAALVIGLVVGGWGLPDRQRQTTPVVQAPAPAVAIAPIQVASAGDTRADRFWSARRLSEQAGGVQKVAAVRWTSPLHGPQLQ